MPGRLASLVRLGDLARGLVDAVLPQTCAACGVWIPGAAGPVCEDCHRQVMTGLGRPYCRRCGRTLPPPAIHEDGCARCEHEHHWNLAGVVRVGTYHPAVRELVLGLKYRGKLRNAEYLADCLAAALRAGGWLGSVDGLVPVPMHWRRRWQRPCDHAYALAEALASRLRLPLVRAVRRVKHSPSQIGISSRAERFENVRGCFGLRAWYVLPWQRLTLVGKSVCIVDNVMGTGATVTEVSKVLRRAGARRIYAAVVARPAAPGDPPAEMPP